MDARLAAAERGRSAPLPGALRQAWAAGPRRVMLEGQMFTFQPVNAWLLAILTRLECPLLEVVRLLREESAGSGAGTDPAALRARIEARIRAEIKSGPDASLELVFSFLTPVEECQAILDVGRHAYLMAARRLLGNLHPLTLAESERLCGEHFMASYATALEISPVPVEGGGGQVFSQPPTETETVSVGG